MKTLVLLALLFAAGCSTTQVIDNTSGTGLNVDASVPIPMSGGQSLLGLKLTAGMWKNSMIVQPTSTNPMYAPNVATAQRTRGSVNASAGTGGTNGAASTVGASLDINDILTGDSSLVSTNLSLQTGK